MYTRSKKESPRRERSGLVSHILLQQGDLPEVGLTVTWVDVVPGSRQRPHEHPSEQVYVITAGSGRMLVGEEERPVGSGDLIYVPPGAVHGIE
ncbi:MAG: cupin domain-containing protein, partial [Actinomycetota bacterium]|nr:cupin domain-containing protein [Actinomycetota bacterium]